jgi:hypothetical protein
MSATRRARNEMLFREVNERIADLSLTDASYPEFVCECARPECMSAFGVPLEVYESVRANDRRFLVLSDHVDPEIEVVVERGEGFVIVEKVGEAAEATDAVRADGD